MEVRKAYEFTERVLLNPRSSRCHGRDASLFFRLVSYRYDRGAVLITTNKGIKDCAELLAGDEILATEILDRLLHHSHVLNIKGRSYRLRVLEQAVNLANP